MIQYHMQKRDIKLPKDLHISNHTPNYAHMYTYTHTHAHTQQRCQIQYFPLIRSIADGFYFPFMLSFFSHMLSIKMLLNGEKGKVITILSKTWT